MRTPSYIAFVAATALSIAVFVPQVFTLPLGPSPPHFPAIFLEISVAFLEAIILGVLIWVGTYIGARWAPPQQRTIRLAQVLGVLYLIIGFAMTLPIKTHALLVDMPPPSASASVLDPIRPIAASIGVTLVILVVSLFLARSLAAICGERVSRDA